MTIIISIVSLFDLFDSLVDLNGGLPSTSDGRMCYKQDPVTRPANRIYVDKCPLIQLPSLSLSETSY